MSCSISLPIARILILTDFRHSDEPREPSDAFLRDLDSVLQEIDCQGSLGIETAGRHDWAEISIGGASVVVRSNNVPLTGYVPVSFLFDKDELGAETKKVCGRDVRHTSKKP